MALMMHDAFSLRGLAAGCALLFLVAPAVQAAEQLPDAPSIDARAWILMDYASGKVLSEGNADEKLDPASLTKIMTSYVVGQAIKAGKIKLTDMVTVGRDAWATGNPALRGSSVMFLKPGMQVSVEDLNKGVIIQSGNDASIAIADYVAGSQDAFVSLMNGYAKKMGLTNTTFMTVHGLDAPGQFSTARDMALLTKALIQGQVVGTIDFKLNDKTIEQRPLIVMESVKEGGFFSRMIDFVLMKLHGWFGSWFS